MTPADAADPVAWASRRLSECGVESPRMEAQLLLALTLGTSRAAIAAGLYELRESAERERFHELVELRGRRVPFAYLRGTQEFYGLDFEVGPAVLIPRPETEMLVEFALERLSAAAVVRHGEYKSSHRENIEVEHQGTDGAGSFGKDGSRRRENSKVEHPESAGRRPQVRPIFADVGTGNGCIAIAVLAHSPSAAGAAFELSAPALETARRNARRHSVDARVRFVQGDLLSGAAASRFDLILSNPPYIPSGEMAGLQPEVRESEPRLALDGGPDGLAPYRRLAPQARRSLVPGGSIAVEVGQGQARDVARIFADAGLSEIEIRRDLAGIERLVAARRARK